MVVVFAEWLMNVLRRIGGKFRTCKNLALSTSGSAVILPVFCAILPAVTPRKNVEGARCSRFLSS